MLDSLRRRQTLASFDFQWRKLARGDAMLSDAWFRNNVDRILADELLCVERDWFRGKTALDAGCGGGRWTLGLLRLGCRVLAVDHSPHAVASTRTEMERWYPEAVAEGRLETERVDLLDLPEALQARRFDLVFSFGVLHHTGDTKRALANLASLVESGGLLFLYLYGRGSLSPVKRIILRLARVGLAPLPFHVKEAVLGRLLPRRDTHQAFDLLSPTINDAFRHETVEAWLHELGFAEATRTIASSELFLRASRPGSAAPFRTPSAPPYWFERYYRRR